MWQNKVIYEPGKIMHLLCGKHWESALVMVVMATALATK
jgi:hypothetical protein